MDDDNYVILPSLLQLLSSYHHSQDVYLGRASLDHPIEAAERVKNDGSVSRLEPHVKMHFENNLWQQLSDAVCVKQCRVLNISCVCLLFKVSVKFWFATGGAGFCISRGLALKMSPWAR